MPVVQERSTAEFAWRYKSAMLEKGPAMSYLGVAPELMAAAAANLESIASALTEANVAAAANAFAGTETASAAPLQIAATAFGRSVASAAPASAVALIMGPSGIPVPPQTYPHGTQGLPLPDARTPARHRSGHPLAGAGGVYGLRVPGNVTIWKRRGAAWPVSRARYE